MESSVRKIILLGLLVSNLGCINAQENIVFNKLRKLKSNEIFIVEDRTYIETEKYYRFTINIKNGTRLEKVLEFRDTISIYMFNNKKRFIVYLNITDWNNPRPLYYIDGENATIEYIGSSFGGYFILEEPMVFIDRIYFDDQVCPNLNVHSILEKKIISTLDTNIFLRSKVKIESQDNFYINFIGYQDYSVPVYNGYIKIYFNHYNEDGPKSFYAYLNIKDIYNLKISERRP